MARVITNYEGKPIGEIEDGKTNWYYSDGAAGGDNGGHYMDTMEFLQYNHLM